MRPAATPLLFGTVDAIERRRSGIAAHRSFRGIGGDTETAQVPCEFPSPFPERGLADVKTLTLFAHSLDHHVDVGVGLIGMQNQGRTDA